MNQYIMDKIMAINAILDAFLVCRAGCLDFLFTIFINKNSRCLGQG